MSDAHPPTQSDIGAEPEQYMPEQYGPDEMPAAPKARPASRPLVVLAFALAFVRLPWVLALLCGYVIFFKKDARLARQCNQAFVLWVVYTAVQFVINLLLSAIRWLSDYMTDPMVGYRIMETVLAVFGGAFFIAYLAVAVVAVIQLLVRGEVSIPLLRRALVCFPPVKEETEEGGRA